jgi:hypothetical protein
LTRFVLPVLLSSRIAEYFLLSAFAFSKRRSLNRSIVYIYLYNFIFLIPIIYPTMSNPFRSKVINLYSDDEAHHLRVKPEADRVDVQYDLGGLPIEIGALTTGSVHVGDKMQQNSDDITAEVTRASDAEAVLTADLSAESARAQTAEQANATAFSDEKARVDAHEIFVASEIATEVAQRQADVATLTASLEAETQQRQASDAVHSADISANDARAISEETRIEAKFDAYQVSNDAKQDSQDVAHADFKASAEGRLDALEAQGPADKSELEGKITDEETARTVEIQRLDDRIDSVLSNVDPAGLDSLSEIVDKFNADGATYADRLTNIESVLASLVEQFTE